MSLAKQMLTFMTIVDEQSFTRAADKLFVTPTALSKQIKLLEAKLGQQLLIRTTRRLNITELGQQFYTQCVQLKNMLDQTEGFIASQHHAPQGQLRILSSLYFSNAFLARHLTEFQQRYPLINLVVEIGDRYPDLHQESFDVMIGFRDLGQITPQLRQRKLHTGRFILCASPAYLAQYGVPTIPTDLITHKLINHPARKPNTLIRFRDGTEIFMQPPAFIVNSMRFLLQLCSDGAGIVMVGEMEALDLIENGKLIEVLPHHLLEEFTVYAFYMNAYYEQQKVRYFIDFFLEKIAASIRIA